MYRCWNLGWLAPPSAGAASGLLPNPVGYSRMYVKLDGAFSVEKWYEGVKAGRVLVSNGPLIFLDAAHKRVEVLSRDQLDRVEIVANGKVIQSWKPRGKQLRARIDADTRAHSWIAARAYTKNSTTVRIAHTAPVKLPGRWDAREDARYFREWIEELQRNPKTPPPSAAGRLYTEALAVYRALEQ